MSEKNIVGSKIYFNKFRVYNYSDGTYRFEDYAPYFTSVIEAITWGRAYDDAEKQIAEGIAKIAELKAISEDLLVGCNWAQKQVTY
jgi:hypothetical protein